MIYGEFASISDVKYKVEIYCDLDYEIGTDDFIQFGDDPITITQDVDDTFTQIIKTQCEINLLIKEYIGDYLFTANDRQIKVLIYKDKDLIFYGYIQPQTYNQDFASQYTEITLNAQDYLCTLINHKYRESEEYDTLKTTGENISFYNILFNDILKGSDNVNVWYDQTIRVNGQTDNVFKVCGISELLMFGDEQDDLWTQEELLTEILQYLNLHVVQFGYDLYVFNWNTIKKGSIITWLNLKTSTTKITNLSVINVSKELYKGDDTQISIADVYNQLIVQCELKEKEELLQSPLDSDYLYSPFTNKNRYLIEQEKTKEDDKPINVWYYQYKNNTQWTLRYYDNGVVKNVSDLVQYDGNGTAINQYQIPRKASEVTLFPLISGWGKVQQSSKEDNTLSSKIDMDDVLTITVNGTEDKDNATATINLWNTIQTATDGLVEYNSTTTAGVISPNDSNVINYIVFSGKIALQPPLNNINTGLNIGFINQDNRDIITTFIEATYTSDLGQNAPDTTKSLLPYVGYKEDKYKEEYGDWFYYKDEEGTDTISKIPILVCQLKIGDKYAVETDESVFEWLTESQCSSRGLQPTFSIGFNPKIGDFLLCKEFDFQNTLDHTMNVDTEGTAIPIRYSDNLSGKIQFKILSPSYTGWSQQIRKHPTAFRHTKWWTTDIPLMEYVSAIYVKDFECKLYSNNANIDRNEEKDLVYITDIINNSVKTKDDITFRFNTALNTNECIEKGINTNSKLSNVVNVKDNSSIMGIYSQYSSFTNKNQKAEEHYINDYYDEYAEPKLMLTTSLNGNTTSFFDKFSFSYFGDKQFYTIGTTQNLKYDSTQYKLKQK